MNSYEQKFIKELELCDQLEPDLDEYDRIKIAAARTFSETIKFKDVIVSKEGLYTFALSLYAKKFYKYESPNYKHACYCASSLIFKNLGIDLFSYEQNMFEINVDVLFLSAILYSASWEHRQHLKYSDKLIKEMLLREAFYKPGIKPISIFKALVSSLPKEFHPSQKYTNWYDIRTWGVQLKRKSLKQSDILRRKRMESAGKIILCTVDRFDHSHKYKKKSFIDWSFCPYCWRPVFISDGKKKCKQHESGSPGYQKKRRLLKRYYQANSYIERKEDDRLPNDERIKFKDRAYRATRNDLAIYWKYLPRVKKYIENRKKGVDLWNRNECLAVLSPEFVDIIENYSFKYTKDSSPYQAAEFRDWTIQAFLVRAEAWLSIEAKYLKKRGGYRKNAGRPKTIK